MSLSETSPQSRLRPALWIGAGGAALAAFAGMFGFHDASVWRLPRSLEAHVEAALQIAGYPGLDVDMDGQKAIIRGVVADQASIDAIRRTALRASGPGGAWAGGVTSVNTRGVTVGAIERPFAWRIRRDGERVVLTGAVPSIGARAALMNAAAASFPNADRIDEMHVAGGAPSSNWSGMARSVIRALALLSSGEARMIDEQVAIIGDGPYASVQRLRQDYTAPAEPFHAIIAVSADGLDLEYAELQGVALASGSAEACAQAFTRIIERRDVTFASASAEIEPGSLPSLNALGSIALRCDRHVLSIRGPADGGAALSLQRAEAVSAHLASLGVIQSHLHPLPGEGRRIDILVTPEPQR